ncbi:DNA polymerase III subunit chi [Neisseria sp. ZJ106]|uniref:DNA polymerase III subunit chi n=1 Tax=Neisseria lisongii TaxID=2912188 RepID=A0ABY7RHW6_9NEIS|nr:DNA polymerase III subunit chi [Neisseria lisongii]MCF7520822.1 DNA polymerase III subunit chi [Neisseria lisongii]WCL70758.1 DNA polymerase III subunit chi [Neisseria lisongii]
MPKATFYTHVADADSFTCRLTARAAQAGGRVLVWSDSAEQIEQLDQALWHYEAESFLAHEIWQPDTPMPSETAVLLASGNTLPAIPADTTVLNLSADFWSSAPTIPERTLEIIGSGLEELADARQRFQAYRRQGVVTEHHNMNGKA